MANQNSKKALAEQLKNRLNSPEYVVVPDLIISYGDRHADMWVLSKGKEKSDYGHILSWNQEINPNPTAENSYEREPSPHWVSSNALEDEDWDEITSLIEKKREEKKKLWDERHNNIKKILNQQPNKLYYYWGKVRKNEKADSWHTKKNMRGFAAFLGGNGNGLTHHCYIAENHPVLDSFSFQAGFYLIDNNKTFQKAVGNYEGGFESSSGETNPNNWKKYFEANEKITITPYQVSDQPDNPKKDNNFPSQKLPNETEIINWLIKYFQSHQIKEIRSENDELTIINNNNTETKNYKQINNNSELQNIQNYLIRHGEKTLSLQKLKDLNNSKSPQNSPANPKRDYIPYLVGGIIGIVLTGLIVVSYYWGKKTNQKK